MQISPPLSRYDSLTNPDCPITESPAGLVRARSSDLLHDPLNLRDSKRRRQNEEGPRAPELLQQWRSLVDTPASLPTQTSSLQPLLDEIAPTFASWGRSEPPTASGAREYLFCEQQDISHLPTPAFPAHTAFSTRPGPVRAATTPYPQSLHVEPIAASVTDFQQEAIVGGYAHAPLPAHESALPRRRETDPASGDAAQKDKYVSGLVGASVIAIESIWGVSPSSTPESATSTPNADASVLPLTWFVREVLRRSRTSCSTLQVSLYYLHKCRREIRDSVARAETTSILDNLTKRSGSPSGVNMMDEDCYPSPPQTPVDSPSNRDRFANLPETSASPPPPNPVLCGRRMFLAALICASKFLQDRNYSNRAWAKISGLPVQEINENERIFLGLMNFSLHLGASDFQKWSERLASLATQGAALESTSNQSAASAALRARVGLARSATEYPAAPPLQQCRMPSPPVSSPMSTSALTPSSLGLSRVGSSLGRSRSQPNTSQILSEAFVPPHVSVYQQHVSTLPGFSTSPNPLPSPALPLDGDGQRRRVSLRRPALRANTSNLSSLDDLRLARAHQQVLAH